MHMVINWVRFVNGMPRFQEQSMWPQGTVVYDLDIIKIKFVVVFHTVLRQKRVLVTCEDGSFMFFCSGSQGSGCLTDVKFFTVFTIDFIHDTSWQVLIEFVLRFLQDQTNHLEGFMKCTAYGGCVQKVCWVRCLLNNILRKKRTRFKEKRFLCIWTSHKLGV